VKLVVSGKRSRSTTGTTSASHISLVLIDDNPASREGVVARIRAQPGFHVIAAWAKSEAALQHVRDTRPDIVLLNLNRDDDDSLTLAGALHGEAPRSAVIIMGATPLRTDISSYIRAGVSGFLVADASLAVFLDTIQQVAHGTRVLPTELMGPLFGQLKKTGNAPAPKRAIDIAQLTRRERSVTELIVQGCSNKEIAARLKVTLHTVKGHVHNILAKLSVNSRLEIAAFSRKRLAPRIDSPERTPVSARDRIA
jgi:two-component system, NarL family, nitrate/nitrite response regulator NarL